MNERHLAMVSEWMEKGNINHFVKENPEADRLGLVSFLSGVSALALPSWVTKTNYSWLTSLEGWNTFTTRG